MNDYEKKLVDAIIKPVCTQRHEGLPHPSAVAVEISECCALSVAKAVERTVIMEIGLGTTIQDGRNGVGEWIESCRTKQKMIDTLERVIMSLKRGDCWCEMAIGNPMVRGHSEGCRMASALMGGEK